LLQQFGLGWATSVTTKKWLKQTKTNRRSKKKNNVVAVKHKIFPMTPFSLGAGELPVA
jgi:hypothetical protein